VRVFRGHQYFVSLMQHAFRPLTFFRCLNLVPRTPPTVSDKVPLESLELAVFVASTTGNGDSPDNMDKFHRFLKRKTHPDTMLQRCEKRLNFPPN